MRRSWIALLLLLALTGCFGGTGEQPLSGKLVKQYGGEKTRPDKVAERQIVLLHPDSKEKINATYFSHGRYNPDVLKQINHLFRDRCTGDVAPIDPELIDYLVDIRSRLGLPPTVVFEILSGYRSPTSNARLGKSSKQVAKNSFHMRGWAVDFRIARVNGKAISEIAKTMQRGGVSYYPSSNHVHVDLGNIRTWVTK